MKALNRNKTLRVAQLSGFLAGLVLLSAAPVRADTPDRTVAETLYGNASCPKGAGNEFVVCARQPENERFRIPKQFRAHPTSYSRKRSSGALRSPTLKSSPLRCREAVRRWAAADKQDVLSKCCINWRLNAGCLQRAIDRPQPWVISG